MKLNRANVVLSMLLVGVLALCVGGPVTTVAYIFHRIAKNRVTANLLTNELQPVAIHPIKCSAGAGHISVTIHENDFEAVNAKIISLTNQGLLDCTINIRTEDDSISIYIR